MRLVVTIFLFWVCAICLANNDQDSCLISAVSAFNNANYEQARSILQPCLNYPEQTNFSTQDFDKYYYLAKSYQLTGHLDSAFVLFTKLIEEISDLNMNFKARVALAELFRYKTDVGKAFEIIEECRKIAESEPISSNNLIYLYNRYAAILAGLPNTHQQVIAYSLKTVDLAKAIGDSSIWATSLNELGYMFENSDSVDWKGYYLQAYEIFKHLNRPIDEFGVLLNLARAHHHSSQQEESVYYSEKAMEIIPKINGNPEVRNAYYFYAQANKELGNYKEAFVGMKAYKDAIVSELTIRWNENFAKLQAEKNEQELLLAKQALIKSKREKGLLIFSLVLSLAFLVLSFVIYRKIRAKNKRLAELSKENELLVSESNHRIKNNLQMITSLVRRSLKQSSNQAMLDNNQEILSKIESIATLHKQLYLNEDLRVVQLKEYLEDILNNLMPLLKEHDAKVKLDLFDIEISINKAVYVGLLFTELTINSMKHAWNLEQKKTITCAVVKNEKEWQLRYKDNGRGIPDKILKPKLVDLLIRQLKGTYQIANKEGFEITVQWKE